MQTMETIWLNKYLQNYYGEGIALKRGQQQHIAQVTD